MQTSSCETALGIEEALGDLSPQAKLAWLRERKQRRSRIMLVGDGINDAPALAAADVAVSFRDATDLAQANSDFILLRDDLQALAAGHRLAQRTRAVILQNLSWAVAYNALAIPAAALGLVPPWAAAAAMSLSSLLVVGNSARLHRRAESCATKSEKDKL